MTIKLLYKCLRCGKMVERRRESYASTLQMAMEELLMLAKVENAELKSTHDCGGGDIGIMDMIGADEVSGGS